MSFSTSTHRTGPTKLQFHKLYRISLEDDKLRSVFLKVFLFFSFSSSFSLSLLFSYFLYFRWNFFSLNTLGLCLLKASFSKLFLSYFYIYSVCCIRATIYGTYEKRIFYFSSSFFGRLTYKNDHYFDAFEKKKNVKQWQWWRNMKKVGNYFNITFLKIKKNVFPFSFRYR